MKNKKIQDKEKSFHDDWAKSENIDYIDIDKANTSITAPEMRYIVEILGDLRGKDLLDVGCGLGEASVFFSKLGANVTASDISEGMLEKTKELAQAHDQKLNYHLSSSVDMELKDKSFDIIYAGNLLHHVNIKETLSKISPHLRKNGTLVTWDPLAYNPLINIYRKIATEVRTEDEHPLTKSDIKLFNDFFPEVKAKYFWLTTLFIFVIMAIFQGRNPNKERFWKVILLEGDKWAWLYRPLESFDRFLLSIFPSLKYLCWNVVIICKKK